MIEPLTVRVDRLGGPNKRTPIPLPDSDNGGANGTGWTKDEVRGLENFLVTQWSGGGLYEISVTDSSEPMPVKMTWQPFWPTNEYPERVPPPLADAVAPDTGTPFATPFNQPSTPKARSMPPFIPPAFNNPQGYGYQLPAPPPVGSPHFDRWRDERDRVKLEDELTKLRAENERRDREAREIAHKAELERERATNDARFKSLESSVQSLVNVIKDQHAAPKGPSPELVAMEKQVAELKEATRRAEERAEQARRESETERREGQLKELIRSQGEAAQRAVEATQKQLEAMQRQHEQTVRDLLAKMAEGSNRIDPMVTLMQEASRQSADMVKEIARENRAMMDGLKAFMMNPRDLLSMARESSQGVEAAMERATKFTDNIVTMQARVLEQAMNLQPQGGGVLEAVREGIGSVRDGFERYVTSKARTEQAAARAQADIAQAQATAIEVQARAMNPAAFQPQAQLTGAPVPPPPPPPPPQSGSQHAMREAAYAPRTEPIPQPPASPVRLWGRTDDEWFGAALPEVQKLRAGVAEFQAAIDTFSKSGQWPSDPEKIPGIKPERAAHNISLAVAMAHNQQVVIPAIMELLLPGNTAEFVGVILPDASQAYRDDVVQVLQTGGNEEDDEEDEDAEDENENGEPENGTATQPAPAPTPVAAEPAGRGRSRRAR